MIIVQWNNICTNKLQYPLIRLSENKRFSRVKKEKNSGKSRKVIFRKSQLNCSSSELWARSTLAAYLEHSIYIHIQFQCWVT